MDKMISQREEQLISAIRDKRYVEFTYNGLYRLCEAHVIGELRGTKAVLAYQIDGESSGGTLPGYRRFDLNKIHNLVVLPERFQYPRRKTPWDTVEAVIERS